MGTSIMGIQDILKALGTSGCLLLDYAKLAGISVLDIIDNFNELVLNNIIRKDCYIKDADKLMKYFDKPFKVIKVNISDILPDQEYIASWENGPNNHFVIMKDDKVEYNTLEFSYCVHYGKINPTVRILEKI